MKKFLLSIIFIILIVSIFNKYDKIFSYKHSANVYSYYNEKNIDVLFIGNSRITYSISPMYIWDKYSVISYNRGGDGQYFKNTFYLTKEFIKRNNPKLVIIDISFFEAMFKWTPALPQIQNMKFSLLKFQAYLDIYNKEKINYLDTYTNIENYHTRWKTINKNDFYQELSFKGYNIVQSLYNIRSQNKNITKDPHIQWNTLQEEPITYLKKIVEYANLNNVKILFIKMPFSLSKEHISLDEQFEQLCKNQNWDFINYNLMYDEIKLDFNRDFRDWSHLNVYGARKVMDHLIPYIIENYNIPIRKDDPKYASWNEDYIKYARAINQVEIRQIKSFQEWQNLAYYDNYTMLISTNGDNVLNRLPQDMKDKFKTLGLNKFETDKKNQKYAAIIDNNQVFFEEVSDNKVEYKGRMKNKVNLLVSSEPNKAIINVSGKPRSKNRYGINFVIYDKVNREIVDSIWVDPAQPDVIRR